MSYLRTICATVGIYSLIAYTMNESIADQDTLFKFAESHVGQCTLGDGYVCQKISEDNFLSHDSLDQLIPGGYLLAWQIACQAFSELPDLTTGQKDLKHYRMGFTEDENSYIVLFSALLLPDKIIDNEPVGTSRLTYGKTVKFWIDKQHMNVVKHLFYR